MGDDSWMFRPRRRIGCTGDAFCSADNRVSLRNRGLRICSPRLADPDPRLRNVVRSGLKLNRTGVPLAEKSAQEAKISTVSNTMHYALATEKSYPNWILQLLRFHRSGNAWQHQRGMEKEEIESFLVPIAT